MLKSKQIPQKTVGPAGKMTSAISDYNFFREALALNLIVRLAGISIVSPVLGLRPFLAALSLGPKVPSPVIVILLPLRADSTMVFTMHLRARPAALLFLIFASVHIFSTNSALVIFLPP